MPSAVPDVFQVEPNYTLTVSAGLGVLINDDLPSNCVVFAVGGDTQVVGEEIALASGAKLTLDEDGSFVYTPHEQYTGVDEFNYTASNGSYWSTAWVSIVVLAEPEEELIEVEAIATRCEYEGDTVSFSVLAEGPDPEATISYYATGLPDGVTINSATGVISGTIGADTAQSLTPVTVSVSDGTNIGSTTFLWAVGSAVTVIETGTQSNLEGDEINAIEILAYSPEEEALTLTVTGLPDGLSFDNETGFITGTLAANTATSTGTTVTVTASDGTYSHTTTFVWKVGVLVGDRVSVEGDEVSLFLGDGGLSGTLSYTSTTLPDGLTLDEETGEISGTIEAGAAIDGLPVLITLTNGTDTVTQTFTWNVSSKYALWVNSIDSEGIVTSDPTYFGGVFTTVSLKLELTDPFGSAVSLGSIAFSASNLPDGLSLSTTANGVELTGTLTYAALMQGFEGNYMIAVTATDGVSSVTKDLFFVVVIPVPRTQVMLTIPDPAGNAPASLAMIAAITNAVAIVRNEDIDVVWAQGSMSNLARMQLDTRFRNNPFYAPLMADIISRFPDDFKQRFVGILRGERNLVKVEAPANPANIQALLVQLGANDYDDREAASAALQPQAHIIYKHLQRLSTTSNDAEIRLRCARLVELVDVNPDIQKTIATIRTLDDSSGQGQHLNAKAFLLNLANGYSDAITTIEAKKAFDALP